MEVRTNSKKNIRSLCVAGFALLIASSSFISIPFGQGTPFNFQVLFSVLAGALLGPAQGSAAVGIFLLLGGLGLPVFQGGYSGMDYLFSTSGVIVTAQFIGSLAVGLYLKKPVPNKNIPIIRIIAGFIIAYLAMYIFAILWLQTTEDVSYIEAAYIRIFPFFREDSIKILISTTLVRFLRPTLALYCFDEE